MTKQLKVTGVNYVDSLVTKNKKAPTKIYSQALLQANTSGTHLADLMMDSVIYEPDMEIGSTSNTTTLMPANNSGKNVPQDKPLSRNPQSVTSFIRDIAQSVDPKNMTYNDSMAIANDLMKAGEGHLSSVFLPPPLIKVNDDGRVTDLTNTAQDDSRMNQTFNLLESLTNRIEFSKSINQPTALLEEAYSFVEKIQISRDTPSINEYT